MTNKLSIVQGDTFDFSVAVAFANDVIFNLTGFTAVFTAKSDLSVIDAAADIPPVAGTINTPSSGVIEIALSSSDTDIPPGVYEYDVEITSATPKKHTVVRDTLRILSQVTSG